jgi:hypothetical protein
MPAIWRLEDWMRVLLIFIFTVGASVNVAAAQVRSHGYVVAEGGGGTASSEMAQIGVGINKVWKRGFSIGTEGGYGGMEGGDFGFWSFNIGQHFRPTSRIVPFVTGGVSVVAWSSGFNVGGGIHRQFSDHFGLRIEFRQYLLSDSCCDGTLGLATGRVAWTFR